jgi:hypothetical protein
VIRVTRPVADGSADLVLAARRAAGRGAWPWHLRLANAELARRTRRRCGVRLTGKAHIPEWISS